MLRSILLNLATLCIASCLTASAFAGNTLDLSNIQVSQKSSDFISLFRTHKRLPRFDELAQWPRETQIQYLHAFQTALVELDAQTGAHDSASIFEQLLLSAYAEDAGPDFCINLGVIKPIDQCNADTLGPKKMHDFDTRTLLTNLGPGANQCPANEKPCSPAFGFDSAGDLYCVGTNRTASCLQKSHNRGNVPLADVLTTCGRGAGAGKAHVSCDTLKSFFDAQTALIEQHCQNSAPTKACGILKTQNRKVQDEVSENSAAMTQTQTQSVADLATQVNHINDALNSPNCPDTETATTTTHTTAPPPAASGSSACQKTPLGPTASTGLSDVLKLLFPGTVGLTPGCHEADFLDRSNLQVTVTDNAPSFIYQPPPLAGKQPPPVPFNQADAIILMNISDALVDQLHIPAKDLAAFTYPTQLTEGTFDVPTSDDGKTKQNYPDREWITSSGNRIRYSLRGKVSTDGKSTIPFSLTLKGQPEIFGDIPVPQDGQ